MNERMVPYFCPYCGDEDLRPSEAGHGSWECRACARAFSVKFVGLVPRTAPGSTPESASSSISGSISIAREAVSS